jgi:rod shape-determining protein MreC
MIKQDKKIYKIILAVFGLLIFLNFIGFLNPINKAIGDGFNFFTTRIRKKSGETLSKNQSKTVLLEKIEELESALSQEKADLSLLSSLKKENEQLRNFFNFFEDNNFNNHLLADIVWQDNLLNFSSTNQNLVINKGEADGVIPGLAVVNEFGILVGKVIEVEQNYSKICLSNNSFCKFAVALNNNGNSSGLAEGDLGLSVVLSFVAQNEDVEVGNIVFTSGLEKNIPKGLYVGQVVNIEKKEI